MGDTVAAQGEFDMAIKKIDSLDVAVVGGGPAGVSAASGLSKSARLKVALFESEPELGGIPRTCHLFPFGMRDMKGMYRGSVYARKLGRMVREAPVQVHTNATVAGIEPGEKERLHRLEVCTPQGLRTYESRYIVLATGCCEASRPARIIPGDRPAGILTTGTLMEMVNVRHQKPGHVALVIGSEYVSLSSVFTLRNAGMSIAGLVEEDPELQVHASVARAMKSFFGFPIYRGTTVNAIRGDKRVEEVELLSMNDQRLFRVKCDTVIISGKFRAYSPLIDHTTIQRDPLTLGPVVNMDLMTSVPNIFSAGNVLRGADMHDLCALEGRQVAQNILDRSASGESENDGTSISIRAEAPVRYVVPQKISPDRIRSRTFSWMHLGFSFQLAHTLKHPVVEVWSGRYRVWRKSFSKLLANTRVVLPVHKFAWNRVSEKDGLTVRVKRDKI